MCTVSFISTDNGIYITSNRDEKTIRASAIPPTLYSLPNGLACFPKDAKAGGTWIAAHENGTVAVLLNGGLEAHTPLQAYRKSRGLIFTDLLSQNDLVQYFQFTIDLNNIEPFTLIVWQHDLLFECIWDGDEKIVNSLNKNHPHIRSSVTLYDFAIRQKRENWFTTWLKQTPPANQDDILHFHEFTGDGDSANDLRMNRDEFYKTVSITGIHISHKNVKLVYKDLQNNEVFQTLLAQKQIV